MFTDGLKRFRILFLAGICCLASRCAASQSATTTNSPEPELSQTGQVWTANVGDEPVGVGDLIYISVTGSPEFTRSYRISNDGRLSLPLVAEPISVVGMAPAEIGRTVSDTLIRERLLVAPIVSVAVLEYRSRQVTVVGAVKSPVTIQATGDLKLLNAIARAQGFSAEAGPEIIVSRRSNDGGSIGTVRIPIKDLVSGKDPSLDIPLHGGEEVRVPEAPKMFVVGNVRMPGSYPLNEMEGSSVLKALALSQGTLPYTAKEAYVYRLVAGGRKEIPIPLRDILHRKSPDFQLQPNDILYVPENSGQRFSMSLLGHITGFGTSVGSSVASGVAIPH